MRKGEKDEVNAVKKSGRVSIISREMDSPERGASQILELFLASASLYHSRYGDSALQCYFGRPSASLFAIDQGLDMSLVHIIRSVSIMVLTITFILPYQSSWAILPALLLHL